MKNFFQIKRVILFLSVFFLAISCIPKRDLIYYQDIDNADTQNSNSYEITIKTDDLLSIIVSAEDPEIAAPFNLNAQRGIENQNTSVQPTNKGSYLVDANGYIDFPVLGKLKLAGLKRTEALNLIQGKVSSFIKDPIVTLRLLNFKVVVQGEVKSPGTYSIESDRLTLIEALAKAGDVTKIGNRKNIMVIREVDGVKSSKRVDITKAAFMNSPYYYLAQNDVVYVEPSYTPINPNLGLITSVASLFITILTFVISTTK